MNRTLKLVPNNDTIVMKQPAWTVLRMPAPPAPAAPATDAGLPATAEPTRAPTVASVAGSPKPVAPAISSLEALRRTLLGTNPQKAIVNAYKVGGFVVLTAILLGLTLYVTNHLFFVFSRGWVQPTVLAPSDPRVLAVASQVTQSSGRRDSLVSRRLELETRLRDAQRIVTIEKAFQLAYKEAITVDLADRKTELEKFKGLLGHYSQARGAIASAGSAFGSSAKRRLSQEFDAHVIDRDRRLAGELQLAQIAESNATVGAKQVELEARVSTLSRQVSSLDSALAAGDKGTSYEILKVRQELDRSILVMNKASDEADAAEKSMQMLDRTIEAEEKILAAAKASPFMQGVAGNATLAFVPYDNMASAKPAAPVYACLASFVLCRKVGTVEQILDGEASAKHPLLQKEIRGVYAAVRMSDATAGADTVLHVGRKPLFI